MLLVGAVSCYLGAEGLSKEMVSAGMPFFGAAVLIGFVMMVVGGVLFARSFVDS